MARARFHKTLFIPELVGQYKLWKTELSPIASKVDEIFQLGNLIGCTPFAADSSNRGANLAILNYIALWRSTFTNWVQLVGPNEIMALNFPDEWTNTESSRLLRKRWLIEGVDGRFLAAAVSKGRLVTHGGLTYGQWVEIGKPVTAQEAADLLNQKFQGTLYQGKSYRLGDAPNFAANPIFASPVRETYPSWITAHEPMPFDQLHTSGGMNTNEGRESMANEFSALGFVKDVRFTSFGSECEMPEGGWFISISPDLPQTEFVNNYAPPWRLYVEKTPVVDLRDEMFSENL